MRKRIATLLALMMLMSTAALKAQVKWGVKGGLNLAALSLKGDIVSSSNNVGFYIGPTVKLSLPFSGLSVDASALYNQFSADVLVDRGYEQIVRDESTIKVKQLAIPINLRYGVGVGSLASVFVFAGPQFAFNIADDIQSIDWKWKNTYTSVNVGVGASLLSHLQLHLNYNIGCGKAGETGRDAYSAFRAKGNVWQIGAAYYF